jgi:hypothetical protein
VTQAIEEGSPELIRTKQIIELVITEARSLYTEIKGQKGISASLKKRALGLHANATLKALAHHEQHISTDEKLKRLSTAPQSTITNGHLTAFLEGRNNG